MPEAPLDETELRLVRAGEGWFAVGEPVATRYRDGRLPVLGRPRRPG